MATLTRLPLKKGRAMSASPEWVENGTTALILSLSLCPNDIAETTIDGPLMKSQQLYVKNRVRKELKVDPLLVCTSEEPYTVEIISTVPILN